MRRGISALPVVLVVGMIAFASLIVAVAAYENVPASPVIPADYNPKQILPCFGSICQNLVGYWPLDEGSGTSAYDLSGNGNTGTLTNSPTWQSGASCEFGSCVSLNGNNQDIQVNDATSLNPSAISISVWLYPVTIPNPGGTRLIDKYPEYGIFFDNNNGRANFLINNALAIYDTDPGCTTMTMALNAWHFLEVSYDGAGHFSMTVDTTTCTKTVAATAITPTTDKLSLGCITPNVGCSSTFDWNGKIDDVRIYNAILTTTQVTQLYAYGLEYHN